MAEQIVSSLWDLLTSTTIEEIQQEIKLLGGVDNEVKRLERHLGYIRAVLRDAEGKPVKESAVTLWFDQLKYISYDIEDVLDRWNTAMMKLGMEEDHDEDVVPQKKGYIHFGRKTKCLVVKSGFNSFLLSRENSGMSPVKRGGFIALF